MRVDQVLCAAGPVDAVTNQALAYRALFRRWGWSGADYAPVQAAGMARGAVRHLRELAAAPEVPLVLHYSGHARGLERALAGRRRTLLVFHNITPPRYFWDIDPAEAVRCELARTQLGELARGVGLLAGVSDFNARELSQLAGREADVIPILFDRRSMPVAPPLRAAPGAPTVLFVGRLTPHKRQDLVIRAFARLRRAYATQARLVLVGTPLSPQYGTVLSDLATMLAPGAVAFESGLSAERLWERYRSADAFVCLSEHEGFCIPLLEAFHFGVPVIARDAGAVAEVVGDAGALVEQGDGPGVVAELLRIVIGDPELRTELAERGRRRLRGYEYEATATRLRGELQRLVAG
jgi:glycosyltransferase involved in cell wall biosynthesis